MLKPNKLANNNFLSSLDLSTDEVLHILDLANNFKNKKLNIDIVRVHNVKLNYQILKVADRIYRK